MVSLHIFDEKFKHLIAIHVKSASAAYNIIWNAVTKHLKKNKMSTKPTLFRKLKNDVLEAYM